MNIQPMLADAPDDLTRLRDRIGDLEFENRQLRAALSEANGEDDLIALRNAFGLKRTGARIVHKLSKRRDGVASSVLAQACLNRKDRHGDEMVLLRNHINVIRRSLGHDAIEAHRGFGYRLSDEMRAKITALSQT